ncbi:protein TonB [Insolitispirillum peregrinum]|uniref:Protein TonB n=2 Tax=Insolitispirillum peregrinum TaxID=80876 RepID=A0A1N7PBV0_9PROT|nr:protein TonB [Insolitispirillum peregrinum]
MVRRIRALCEKWAPVFATTMRQYKRALCEKWKPVSAKTMRQNKSRFFWLLAGSLLAHGGALAAMLMMAAPPVVTPALPVPQVSLVALPAQQEAAPVPPAEIVRETPTQAAASIPSEPLPPEPPVLQTTAATPQASPPKPPVKRSPRPPVAKPRPQVQAPMPPTPAEASESSTRAVSGQQQDSQTVSGVQQDARAGSQVPPDYLSLVLGVLERAKRYPPAARAMRAEGVVSVRFTILSSGEVRNGEIVSPSGVAVLDQEGLALIARVSPLPPLPADYQRDRLTLVIPIRFNTRMK